MCSETSDEEIYITQSTFCQQADLADVNDRVLDEQALTANVGKQKATAENRFANPISEVEIQAKIGDAVPKSTNIKKNGLSTCSRTGDSKEMRESAMQEVLSR